MKWCLVASVFALVSCVAYSEDSTCTTSVLISKSDSCATIAKRFKLSLRKLLEVNPELNCEDLHVDTTVCINRTDAAKEPSCSKKVTILPGDTCFNLSITYNTIGLVDGLQKLNPQINCDNLVVGAVVCVRDGPDVFLNCESTYVVKPRDSCFKIVNRFDLEDVDSLHRLNPFLDCFGVLQPGQLVCIKSKH